MRWKDWWTSITLKGRKVVYLSSEITFSLLRRFTETNRARPNLIFASFFPPNDERTNEKKRKECYTALFIIIILSTSLKKTLSCKIHRTANQKSSLCMWRKTKNMLFILSSCIWLRCVWNEHLLISFDWISVLSMFVLLWHIIFRGMMLRYLMFVQLYEDPRWQQPLWLKGDLYKGICLEPLITKT